MRGEHRDSLPTHAVHFAADDERGDPAGAGAGSGPGEQRVDVGVGCIGDVCLLSADPEPIPVCLGDGGQRSRIRPRPRLGQGEGGYGVAAPNAWHCLIPQLRGPGEMNRDGSEALNGERRLRFGGNARQALAYRAEIGGGDRLVGEKPVEEPVVGQGLEQRAVDLSRSAGLGDFDQGVPEPLTFLDERPGHAPSMCVGMTPCVVCRPNLPTLPRGPLT